MRRIAITIVGLSAVGLVPETRCPDDMVQSGAGSCIDRYEWPNRKGAKPLLGASGKAETEDVIADRVLDAERLCAGVGKRVCERDEWIAACEGKDGAKYPFGNEVPKYDPRKRDGLCNYDKRFRTPDEYKVWIRDAAEMKRLDQSEAAGTRESCRSASGAYDMMGNAEEWVRCPGVGEHGWCLMGRFWASPKPCRFTVRNHSPKWHFYSLGLRCCK